MWRSECVWILGASIGAFHPSSDQTSIVWDSPFDRPSVSIGEIGLPLPEVKKIFLHGGFSRTRRTFDGAKKYCSIQCSGEEHCDGKLFKFKLDSHGKIAPNSIIEENELVNVDTGGRLEGSFMRRKVKFGDLMERDKMKFLLSRVRENQKIIQKWKKIKYEQRDLIHNTDMSKFQIDEHPPILKGYGSVSCVKCDLDKILRAIGEGKLALTGPNTRMLTDGRSQLKVDAGQSVVLKTIRSHTRFWYSYKSYIFLSIMGDVYEMHMDEGQNFRDRTERKVNVAYSLTNKVGYNSINYAYTSPLITISEDLPDTQYVIGRLHPGNDRPIEAVLKRSLLRDS